MSTATMMLKLRQRWLQWQPLPRTLACQPYPRDSSICSSTRSNLLKEEEAYQLDHTSGTNLLRSQRHGSGQGGRRNVGGSRNRWCLRLPSHPPPPHARKGRVDGETDNMSYVHGPPHRLLQHP
jgi:hypothetical protein